jgi:translation initiation factor 3 subunit J
MDNITAQERRRQARERELEADMAVASDLMGGMGVEDGVLAYNPTIPSSSTDKTTAAIQLKQRCKSSVK